MSKQSPIELEPRQPGSAAGKLIIHAAADEHLADLAEYFTLALEDYSQQREEILPSLTAAQIAERIAQQRES